MDNYKKKWPVVVKENVSWDSDDDMLKCQSVL